MMTQTSTSKLLAPYAFLMSAILVLSAYSLLSGGQYDILFAFYTLPVITFLFFAFHFVGRGMKLAEIHAREEMALTETSAYDFLAPRVLRLFALYFAASAIIVVTIVVLVGVYEYRTINSQPVTFPTAYSSIYSRGFYTFSTSLLVHYSLAFVSGWIILLAACLRIFRGLCRRANLERPQNILPYFHASLAAFAAWLLPWVAGFTTMRFLADQVDADAIQLTASILFQVITLACYAVAAKIWRGTCAEYYRFENT